MQTDAKAIIRERRGEGEEERRGVRVWERERERERWGQGGGELLNKDFNKESLNLITFLNYE